jgi:hypothetical protein
MSARKRTLPVLRDDDFFLGQPRSVGQRLFEGDGFTARAINALELARHGQDSNMQRQLGQPFLRPSLAASQLHLQLSSPPSCR